ncbi:TP901 family phage tail tape measure protein [Friedmanniella endophytica]|uniref:TP901 family phage tail tape measure protein n=1 Tax=Microlunatus kandeliicorticis TaxID=1759536 RepID=A0A7W3P6F4_9ACTN|nr:phage tail tape measure protein [Microlunatus kandeliicorticis]MBA8794924.1 TP901 family phage tail tape measure protein [Microlunatus kandeliicorticis]
MAERSIVAKLRADISGLRAGLTQAQGEIRKTAAVADAANKTNAASALKAADAEKVRAAVRTQAAAAEVAASEKQLIAAQKYGKITSTVTAHRDTLDKVGRGFSVVGLAAAAGFGVAVKSAADFDQAMSGVASTGADARQNLSALRAEAVKAGAATKYSATDAAGGVEELLKAGVSAKDVLGGGLAGALNLAAAGNQSVGEAAETAASAMNQFQLRGSDVTHVADLLAQGAGTASGEVSDLAMALRQSGGVAKQYGLSIDETVESLALFAKQGYTGSDAGTSFKTMLQSLYAPVGSGAKALDKLGISAYDASGNIKDIGPLMDELNGALSGLSEGDRNQALSQIFGSDAIRVAPILLKAGSAGLKDMGAEFANFGTAAEVASTKMDNLNGDLETFRGSVETALIGAGSGGTKALRDLTQGATELVNEFNYLPAGAQHATLMGAAIVAAAGLGVGALIKLTTTAAATRAALIDLNSAGRLTALASAAGPAAIALVAVGAAGTGLDALGQKVASVDQVTDALRQLAKTGDDTALTLDTIGKTNAADAISDSLFQTTNRVSSLGEALAVSNVQQTTSLGKLQAGYETFREALIPGQQGLEKQREAITNVDTSLAKMVSGGSLDAAVTGYQRLLRASGKINSHDVQQFSAALSESGFNADQVSAILAGKLTPAAIANSTAVDGMTDAQREQTTAFSSAREALEALSRPLARTAEQNQQLASSLFDQGNAYQSTISAHSAYAASIDQASATLKANADYTNKAGTALSDNTAKGRENIDALNGLASAGKAYVSSLAAQGAGNAKIVGATKAVRAQFVKAAEDAGLTGKAARALADSYGLVPAKVTTEIDAFGLAVQKQEVEKFSTSLSKLPKEQQARIIAVWKKEGAQAALAELNKLDKKKASPKIDAQSNAPKVSKEAQGFMRAIKDVDPKIKTGDNTKSVAAAAQRYLDSIKGKNPRILTSAQLDAARSAKNLIDSIHSKSVSITTTHTTINNTISRVGKKAQVATGGYIQGPGTTTSDSIPALLSNKEFVVKASSTESIGVDRLQYMNATGRMPAFADGGLVGYASGGQVDYTTIRRLLTSSSNPLGEISAAARAMTLAAKAVKDANRAARVPTDRYNAAKRDYNRAVDARDELRSDHAEEQKRQKDRIAVLQKRAAATKGTTKADRDLTAARAKLAKLDREYSADLQKANDKVKARDKTRKSAQDAYNKAAEKSKAATDKLKDAQAKLLETQKALADSARQTSESFYGANGGQMAGGVLDWLDQMRQGAKDITAFQKQLDQLRKAGLSEPLVQEIASQGTLAGGDIATQILQGGKSLVSSLDSAQKSLQSAADNIGLNVAQPTVRRAAGGPIYGPGSTTSDSILVAASNEEFMQSAAAHRFWGTRFMDDVNNRRLPQRFASMMAGSQPRVVQEHHQHNTFHNSFPSSLTAEAAAVLAGQQTLARLSAMGRR